MLAGQKQKIDGGPGYSPAKPKTKCPALNIGLASKWLVLSVEGTCGLSLMEWWRWWLAGNKRSTGQEYSPAQPKAKCPALDIGLASKRLEGTCGLSLTEWLRWWQAGSKRSTGAGIFPCQTKIRGPCTQYWSDIKTLGGERGGNLWVEFDRVVAVVAGQKQKINGGWGYSPAKPKGDVHTVMVN